MIESPDRIYIPHLANMRYTLQASGVIGPRYIALMLLTFFIFIVGNFGWRLLGVIKLFKNRNYFNWIIVFNIIILSLIPTLFIQLGTSWNTIQFIYYALFLGNILLAASLSALINKKTGKILIAIVFSTNFIAFIGTVGNYLGQIPPAALPTGEISALKYLAIQKPGIVLTVPYDGYLKQKYLSTPIPLYAYETTAYVSAYSRHLTFFEDEMNLINSSYDLTTRKSASFAFFQQKNTFQDRGFLVNNQIEYIYIAGKQQEIYHLDTNKLYLTQIFKNSDATIYRVQR